MSSVRHPHIVQLYDAFPYNGWFNVVLEKCDGSLRQWRQQQQQQQVRITDNTCMQLIAQLLSGLSHLHSRLILHRDLHCDNVLYCIQNNANNKITLKITDFGISSMMDALTREEITRSTIMGRNYDHAPELLEGRSSSVQSDLYQLGLTGYYLLMGHACVSDKDGSPRDAALSGVAKERAEKAGPVGKALSMLLELKPEDRPKDCQDAWRLMFNSVYKK